MSNKGPRQPKGESGPAKSSKHLQRAAASGLYQDPTRFAALETLLGKGAVATTSTASAKKKDDDEAMTGSPIPPGADPASSSSSSAATTKQRTATTKHMSDNSSGAASQSCSSADDIFLLLGRIGKKGVGETALMKTVHSLVCAYGGGGHQHSSSSMMERHSSTMSSSSSAESSAGRAAAPDEAVIPTVASFCEQLQLNCFHSNSAIRRGFAMGLYNLLSRSNEVRQAVGSAMAKSFASWLCLCGDPSSDVSRPAHEALDKIFAPASSKRAQVFAKFSPKAVKKLIEHLASWTARRAEFFVAGASGGAGAAGSPSSPTNNADSADTTAGNAVGQIFGALQMLLSELKPSFSSPTSSAASSSSLTSGTPPQQALRQARLEVITTLAAALGFNPDGDDADDSSTAGGHSGQPQPLSFVSQKKNKNKKAAKDERRKQFEQEVEGSAVFGSSAAVAGAGASAVVPQIAGVRQQSVCFNALRRCLPAGMGATDGDDEQQQRSVLSTSERLRSKLWGLVGEIILFMTTGLEDVRERLHDAAKRREELGHSAVKKKSTVERGDDDAENQEQQQQQPGSSKKQATENEDQEDEALLQCRSAINFCLAGLFKTMSSTIFDTEETSRVQQSLWGSLVSSLHTIISSPPAPHVSASSSASSSIAAEGPSFTAATAKTIFEALRKTLWPCVVDALDNCAEGDVSVLPVAMLDAFSSLVLLMQKLSGDSFLPLIIDVAEPQQEKDGEDKSNTSRAAVEDSCRVLKNIFDRLVKTAEREFAAWKEDAANTTSSSSQTTTSAFTSSDFFFAAMRSVLEFLGTILHLALTSPPSSPASSSAAAAAPQPIVQLLTQHCMSYLLTFAEKKLLATVRQQQTPDDVAVATASASSTNNGACFSLESFLASDILLPPSARQQSGLSSLQKGGGSFTATASRPAMMMMMMMNETHTNTQKQQQQQHLLFAAMTRMLFDLGDRFAGWTLLSAKFSKSSIGDAVLESLAEQCPSRSFMSSMMYPHVVRRWLNLELPSSSNSSSSTMDATSQTRMTNEATKALDGLATVIEWESAASVRVRSTTGAATKDMQDKHDLACALGVWLLREVVNAAAAKSKQHHQQYQNFLQHRIQKVAGALLKKPQVFGAIGNFAVSSASSAVLSTRINSVTTVLRATELFSSATTLMNTSSDLAAFESLQTELAEMNHEVFRAVFAAAASDHSDAEALADAVVKVLEEHHHHATIDDFVTALLLSGSSSSYSSSAAHLVCRIVNKFSSSSASGDALNGNNNKGGTSRRHFVFPKKAQCALLDWLEHASAHVTGAAAVSESSSAASSSAKTTESLLSTLLGVLRRAETTDSVCYARALKVLQTLSQKSLEPLSRLSSSSSSSAAAPSSSSKDQRGHTSSSGPSGEDAFPFVPVEVQASLLEADMDYDDEEEEEEEPTSDGDDSAADSDDNDDDASRKKKKSAADEEDKNTSSSHRQQVQYFLHMFDLWAQACEMVSGGNALVVDFASRLDDAVSREATTTSAQQQPQQQQQHYHCHHVPVIAAALRAHRFPMSCISSSTWNAFISSSSRFSLVQLLSSDSAKKCSVHDFSVAQFPTHNVVDFAIDAGVPLEALNAVARVIVVAADALHAATTTETRRSGSSKKKSSQKSSESDSSCSSSASDDEEEEEEDDQQEAGDQQSSTPRLTVPDPAVGTALLLPVMQLLSVRNLWTAKVKESLKFVMNWCFECLFSAPPSNGGGSAGGGAGSAITSLAAMRRAAAANGGGGGPSPLSSSSSGSPPPSTKTMNAGAVTALAESCVAVCLRSSEEAPFLLTGPLALLAQLHDRETTNAKSSNSRSSNPQPDRYDRLLRAIYGAVANAWASDMFRFSPQCFCPWPGSAMDGLLWSALMPRGVSLTQPAIDKLRRSISMPAQRTTNASSSSASSKTVIENAVTAMQLLALLPESSVAASGHLIEVNHVTNAMRFVTNAARASASASSSSSPSSSPTTTARAIYIAGLGMLSSLSRCAIVHPGALPEVAAAAVNCLTQAYRLQLLPPAGKFAFQQHAAAGTEAQDDDDFDVMFNRHQENRKIIQSLAALRHGVKAHLYRDDGLTSAMNLCVLDMGCALGAKLQKFAQHQHQQQDDEDGEDIEQELLLMEAYDVSQFLSSDFLSQDDLRALRASAATVDPIARFVIGTHFWLCSRPVRAFTDEFISKATTIANLAAQLAVSILIGCRPLCDNAPILQSLIAVFARPPLRPLPCRAHELQQIQRQQQQQQQAAAAAAATATGSDSSPSWRAELAALLSVPPKQLALSAFRKHANFLMQSSKMRVTAISYFCLAYVYLSLSDSDKVAPTVSGVAVVQAVDLILACLTLRDSSLVDNKPIYMTQIQHHHQERSAGGGGRQQHTQPHSNNRARSDNNDDEEAVMSPYLEIATVADPKWLQPAAKSPVVSPAQLKAHCGRWAAACLGLIIQRPVLVTIRMWRDALHHTASEALTGFVNEHFSPYLARMAMLEVVSHAPPGELNTLMSNTLVAFHPEDEFGGQDVTIEVDHAARKVSLKYATDEIETSLSLRVPAGFPLGAATVADADIGIKGVRESKRRSWLLRMSANLLNGSATLWSAVALFCENLKREFEGVEPCPICYMITAGNELPTMTCRVCRNAKFHKQCLTQWWATAPQSVCPMCRSPWFS